MGVFAGVVCIFLTFVSGKVNGMSIRGPAIIRYDPCGLGVIYFDKITEYVWQGVMNLGLYPELDEVEIRLKFEQDLQIYGATQNTSVSKIDDWYYFTLKGEIPKTYNFFIDLSDDIDLNNETEPTVTTPNLVSFVLNNKTLCDGSTRAAQTVDSLNVTESDNDEYAHICGRRSMEHTEFVSVRSESQAGDWPWHVAILLRDKRKRSEMVYRCGGSIISRTTIVTAGHCLAKTSTRTPTDRVVIVAGTNDYKDEQHPGRQVLTAQEVILHPSFIYELATSDLAIIKVNKLEYTQYVQPICIWGPVYDKTILFGQQATVVGFGSTEENKLSDVLRSVTTVIQNDTTCIDDSPKVYEPLISEFSFCAGYGPESDVNPRNGDSGGGLVVTKTQPDHKVSWFLRGVLSKCGVSPGHTECNPKFYVVYTDVAPHYGWLYHHSGLHYSSNVLETNI